MSKGLIFFCCACAILLFTIINLSVGPIISGKVGNDYFYPDPSDTSFYFHLKWGTANCKYISDIIDESNLSDDELKYGLKWYKNECERKNAMHDMEYTSFIFNAIIGFSCGLLGLLHLFDLKKEFVSKTGIIGLACGIVGFIFSFVYVVLNGLVYTTYYDHKGSHPIYKRDSDLVFAEKKGAVFECLYFDSPENVHSLYAKYSDLIQKQYNYDKDLYDSSSSKSNCVGTPSLCQTNGKVPGPPGCTKLYTGLQEDDIENKDISDRFLTTLLLSLFVCLANIGLGIFGFLLYRTPGEF